jgi:amidase
MTRRDTFPLLAAGLAPAKPAGAFDPAFSSALSAAAAIRARKISSVELTKQLFARIDKHQPALNAFVYQTRDEALAAAQDADKAIATGKAPSPLAGVPFVNKESFAVAGRPCTWGVPALKNSKAPANSTVVQRLLDAGAILLGSTNVPVNLDDWQSNNDIYGTTNNPWDLTRTPGGSSGGTCAALAAGLGFFGTGSDIGGSIRVPAHFCGLFGHKPTLDLVPETGHTPGGRITHGFSTLLAVGGPLARSAEDLEAALRIIGGPDTPDSAAYSWRLPSPRHQNLRDFRLGYMLADPSAPVSSEVATLLESAIRVVEKSGATLRQGLPQDYSFKTSNENYLSMLGAFIFSMMPPDQQKQARPQFTAGAKFDPYSRGAVIDYASWQQLNLARLAARARWQTYFKDIDAFLLPVFAVPAFPHDHNPNKLARTVRTPEGTLPYLGLIAYPHLAIFTGLPATIAPIGRTKSGLPVGIQIIGPYLEDATPIRIAALLSKALGGFTPPPGY